MLMQQIKLTSSQDLVQGVAELDMIKRANNNYYKCIFTKIFDYPTRIRVGQFCPILKLDSSQKADATLKKLLEQI